MTIFITRNNTAFGGCLWLQYLSVISILFAITICNTTTSSAQVSTQQSASDTPVIVKVDIEGGHHFSEDILRAQIKARPNQKLLEIPGFTPWLWFYNLGNGGTSRFAHAIKEMGEPPAWLDNQLIQADTERLTRFYRQEGFRNASVESYIVPWPNQSRVQVLYRIIPGTPTIVRTVYYSGIDRLHDQQRDKLLDQSIFKANLLDSPDTSPRYSESQLVTERKRIIAFLRDEGYAEIERDSIRAIIIPVDTDSFDINFRIRMGRRFKFGDIRFVVHGQEPDTVRLDTLSIEPASGDLQHTITEIHHDSALDPAFLFDALQFKPGNWYNASQLAATKRRLESAAIFSFSNLRPLWSDITISADSTDHLLLPQLITLRTHSRHRIRFESFVLQRSGISDESATGIGTTYRNLNTFGEAEVFELRLSSSIAGNFEEPLSTLQAEISTSLNYPYLIKPFKFLSKVFKPVESYSHVSISFLTAKRTNLIIRGRSAFQLSVELKHNSSRTTYLDLIDFSLSDPDTVGANGRSFKSLFLDGIEPIDSLRIVEDYTRPKINNALRYTLRQATVHRLRRDNGYSTEFTAEIGGNLPWLLDRFILTPDTLEGALPRLGIFNTSGKQENSLEYGRYTRFLFDHRRYMPVGKSTTLATKFIAGWVNPIGEKNTVPFERRFFAGGGSSVRGWSLRDLGPGGVVDTTGRRVQEGGDIKIEAGAELRITAINNLLGAKGILVWFTDAGNIWLGPKNPGGTGSNNATRKFKVNQFYKQFGLGAGIGVRFDWDFFIIRFDLAWQLHSPADIGGGWFPGRPPRLHFGIGHTF